MFRGFTGIFYTLIRSKLDMIYDDGLNSINTSAYSKLIFWNGTVCDA